MAICKNKSEELKVSVSQAMEERFRSEVHKTLENEAGTVNPTPERGGDGDGSRITTKHLVAGGGAVAGGAMVGGGVAIAAGPVLAATAVPTLMSTFSAVTAGVGSTMPFWLPTIQSFGAVGLGAAAFSPLGLVVIGVGAVAGGVTVAAGVVGGAIYKKNKKNCTHNP